MKIKKGTNDITKVAIASMVAGSIFGMMANSIFNSQNSRIKRTASRALNTVGETMQNISTQIK